MKKVAVIFLLDSFFRMKKKKMVKKKMLVTNKVGSFTSTMLNENIFQYSEILEEIQNQTIKILSVKISGYAQIKF